MQTKDVTIKRALLSVSDKTDITKLAQGLHALGVEIISTGGTAKVLTEAGIPITGIQEVTGNPEAFGGRMKTISFQIESALLYRRGHDQDEKDAKELGINPIDLVVCNLYPFAKAVEQGGDEDTLIENIDIGGPTMVRAAAKNYESVTVLSNPAHYDEFLQYLNSHQGALSFELRRKYAIEAFKMTAYYDVMIADELNNRFGQTEFNAMTFYDAKELRYGENPHQAATFYQFNNAKGNTLATAKVLQGKPLSYNNLLDADAAWKSASDAFHTTTHLGTRSAVAVIKHLNPCGLAVANNSLQALEMAWAGDPVSAFGSIICFSAEVDAAVANWFKDKFVEIIIAPSFSNEAKDIFAGKKNLRLLETPIKDEITHEKVYRSISGGLLVQNEDEGMDREFEYVTKRKFDDNKMNLAKFGIAACKNLKSNAIALVSENNDGSLWLTGAGMGQPNRLDSLRCLSIPRFNEKEGVDIKESVLISDAFFPFRDSIDAAREYNVQYIVQPGGSIRDKEVIEACDEFDMAMIFTGKRHFRH
jgi:phosphoribosylaminoimidazolecarboxamide formyltransferase/IMP cyclohydrolase